MSPRLVTVLWLAIGVLLGTAAAIIRNGGSDRWEFTAAGLGAWRFDTRTGHMEHCFASDGAPSCQIMPEPGYQR